jgi:hypothetical protein
MLEEYAGSDDVLGVADKGLNHNKHIDLRQISRDSDTIFR